MSPFKKKAEKWDGDDADGRFMEKNGFKYDIIAKESVAKPEDMPSCFLANTPKEAEALYKEFEGLLNNFAYSYSVSTGIDKADLFREAMIGLARAKRDWDNTRSENFKSYAIYRIKDALNEFVRENAASVSVPAYIKKANANLEEIRSICNGYGIKWENVVIDQNIPLTLEVEDAVRCADLVSNLIKAASRAKVEYEKFIERIIILPHRSELVEHEHQHPSYNREGELLEAALVVEKLKKFMTKLDRKICEGIMQDKSYEQIGKEMNRSKAWVAGKIKELRNRVLSKGIS